LGDAVRAGYVAAPTAATKGHTTILSGGTMWVPNNSLMREHGLSDPATVYWGPVPTIGPALSYGHIAGLHASRNR
jgi:hypothetical protein